MARPCGREATWPRGRPCGAPRVSSVEEGTETKLIGEFTPLFNRVIPRYFLCVGLCPTWSYLLQVTWMHGGRWIRSERQRSRGPESTRSSIKHVRLKRT